MMKQPSRPQSAQYGATLIEVLVSVVIVAFGLLGLAGLLIKGASLGVSAYNRTIVTQKIYALADRMRLNPTGVQAGNYTGAVQNPAPANCASCPPAGCTPAAMAAVDVCEWARELGSSLAAGVTGQVGATTDPNRFSIQVTWQEKNLLLRNPVTQTYNLDVRP